ncbi:MAG: hypothetical protein WEB57_14475 [Pseudohongiellaceae bacterium]
MDEASRHQPDRSLLLTPWTQEQQRREATERHTDPLPASRRPALWCALYLPDIRNTEHTLEAAAGLCQQVSDYISLLPPDALVFEAGSSLRYFHGIHPMRHHLAGCLQSLQQPWTLAASPAAAASALLARSGRNALVADPQALRAALGPLPLNLLPVSGRQLKRLHHSGLRTLRDLWRLPSSALRQRLGREPSEFLACCLGQRAWPLPRWQAPLHFHQYREVEWPLTRSDSILRESGRLLELLEQFLQRHNTAVDQMVLELHDAAGEVQTLALSLRHSSRRVSEWQPLLELQLAQTAITAPVHGIALEVRHFVAFDPHTAGFDTFRNARQQQQAIDSAWQKTLDLLQARLGRDALLHLTVRDDWTPEQAVREAPAASTPRAGIAEQLQCLPGRPAWLITPPRRLQTRNGQPWLDGRLLLLRGPERIQTRWWSREPTQRDYYVAETMQGQRVWVFRQLMDPQHWYLHGLFG